MRFFFVPTIAEKLKQKSDCYTNEYKVIKGKKTKWILKRSSVGLHMTHCGFEWIENVLE